MTEQHWNEFLEKLDFAELTSRWSVLPLHWLDQEMPAGLDPAQEALYRGLMELPKELDTAAREARILELVSAYRAARSARSVTLEASLTPGSRVVLRYLNPEDLGHGDCLITLGSWDRLGHFIAQKAGLADEQSEPSENPVRRDPGKLAYRDLLLFPDKGTPSPRAFRNLCEKTLRQARGLGARRLSITHLHLPQPGLPDRFAAAELVSAVRQMVRDGGGITVEILPLTTSTYEDYLHWFTSLGELARGEGASSAPPPSNDAGPSPESEPAFGNALRDVAQKTSSLAQEAARGVSSWFRAATAPSPQGAPRLIPRLPGSLIEPTFEDQQALNLLYLGRWQEAEVYRQRWEEDSLLGLYLAALHKVVSYIELNPVEPPATPQPEEAAPPEPAAKAKKKAKSKKKGKNAPAEEPVAEEPATPLAEEESATPAQESPVTPPVEGEAPAPLSEADQEYLRLREQLLSTAQELGAENPLARYFQLLAWRLDERRPEADADQLEEDHARLLRAAWAWEDSSMLTFLRQIRQDQENEAPKPSRLGYVPVFPSGSRTAPRLD